jgi:hypothetical protein
MRSVTGFTERSYLESTRDCNRRITSSGMLRRVARVRTDVSEERSVSIIRVTRISEVGTTLAVTGNQRTLLTFFLTHRFLSPWWLRRCVPPKRRFLQEPHGVTSQKMAFFTVTAVKTSNLTQLQPIYGLTYYTDHCKYSTYSRCLVTDSNKRYFSASFLLMTETPYV